MSVELATARLADVKETILVMSGKGGVGTNRFQYLF
jgi:hypothetical protein